MIYKNASKEQHEELQYIIIATVQYNARPKMDSDKTLDNYFKRIGYFYKGDIYFMPNYAGSMGEKYTGSLEKIFWFPLSRNLDEV